MFKTISLLANVLLPFGAFVLTAAWSVHKPTFRHRRRSAHTAPIKTGTIDLNEAKVAAAAVFDKLDVDKDGTLGKKELQGPRTKRQFREADPER